MEFIRVGTNMQKDKVNQIILSCPFDAKLKVQNETFDNIEFFVFKIDKHKLEDINLFNGLAKIIQNIFNKLYLKELIDTKVSSILQEYVQSDIDEVSNTVYDLLLDENYFEDDKKYITKEIREYLFQNNTLILDGYLRFRSKSFEKLIDKIIEKVISDIQMESEYDDFIEMLQFYLDCQIPKVDVVNVIINNHGLFLLDQKNKPIETTSINSIVDEYGVDEISKADILVSSLIVLAPNKVVIHLKNDKEKELMQVLKKIFGDRLSFCYSCSLCDMYMIKKDSD